MSVRVQRHAAATVNGGISSNHCFYLYCGVVPSENKKLASQIIETTIFPFTVSVFGRAIVQDTPSVLRGVVW